MNLLVAWRILAHEPGRNMLAIGGIYVSVLMIFMQLGFYYSVPRGGMTLYDAMYFDIMLTPSDYVLQGHSAGLPRRRLYQASSLPEVMSVSPLYQNSANWHDSASGLRRQVFVMAIRPADPVFVIPAINRQIETLSRPDTILVDTTTRPAFGPLRAGRMVEVNNRTVAIGGVYTIGTGFVGIGALITSDLNFERMFPAQSLGEPSLGLIGLRSGADVNRVAQKLRAILPNDTRVFTHDELASHESAQWVTRTSTGLIFGFGTIVSFVVGSVILYQTLAAQVSRLLPQYAMLKAIGYANRDLSGIVLWLATIMAAVGFVPALVSAIALYALVRVITILPVDMSGMRIAIVLLISLVMSASAGLLSLSRVRQADPVDVF